MVIAALCKLKSENGEWVVPSQSGAERLYRVNPTEGTCTCPDHAETGAKCKHVYAVEFTMKREVGTDGIVTETKTITFTEKKVYKQDWPAYTAAQYVEKRRVQELLFDLARGIPEPDRSGIRGRKPHTVRDSLFAMVFKVYSIRLLQRGWSVAAVVAVTDLTATRVRRLAKNLRPPKRGRKQSDLRIQLVTPSPPPQQISAACGTGPRSRTTRRPRAGTTRTSPITLMNFPRPAGISVTSICPHALSRSPAG